MLRMIGQTDGGIIGDGTRWGRAQAGALRKAKRAILGATLCILSLFLAATLAHNPRFLLKRVFAHVGFA